MTFLIATPIVLFCSLPILLTLRRHNRVPCPVGFGMQVVEMLLATVAFVGLAFLCDWAVRLWIG